MKQSFLLLTTLFTACVLVAQNTGVNTLTGKHVLVFTKNGEGYVHENIPFSIAALQKMGMENNFRVDTTTNASVFTDENLKKYDALIFSNTNNNVFDTEEQRQALVRYIHAGGGFMGIHSATGTERNWKWFKQMLGATFLRHSPFQAFHVYVLDKEHPATKNLQPGWEIKDECYYFKEINPSIHVLTVSDISSIREDGKNVKPDVFGDSYPSSWCQLFEGGRIWYTALGHDKSNYSDPVYLSHLKEGLKWVTDKPKPDYRKLQAH